MKNNKLIVVLGMHRSGTSAIARGLEVFGVKLGDNLHPAAIDNPKGFWEDRSFLGINEELLAHLGSAYDCLGLVNWNIQNGPAIKSIRLKAEKLVREKCEKNTLWGFKDPRTARLLPFWQSVFEYVGCDVGYIIATRNPISIVESLRKRNGFEPEKTFYLWLEHLIPAISRTKGAKRVVVDYDRLLENPRHELLRVARALGLPAPESLALAAYENEFLEGGLRHTIFTTHDLDLYPSVPSQVITGYDWLMKLANDSVALDSSEIEQAFDTLSRDLVALSPALNFMARKDDAIGVQAEEIHRLNAVETDKAAAYHAVAEELQRVHGVLLAKDDAIGVQAEEIHRLNAVVTDKAAAYQAVEEELQRVHGVLLAKDDAIGVQAEEIRQFSSELKDSRHEVAQHTEEINHLGSFLAQRDQSVETLNNSLRHMEEVLFNVKEELSRSEAELQTIRRTKWFRLRDAIIHQPWGFRKVARVAYLAGAMAIPPLIRARLSPLVFRIRARLNASRHVLLSNTNENGAYLVRQPAPAMPNRPHVVHIIANFMTGGSSRLVVDLIEYLGAHYEQSVVTSYIPIPPAYVGIDITEYRFPADEQPFVEYFSHVKPALIHVHYWGDCDEPWYAKAIAAAEHLGIPIVENINTPVTPYISDAVRRYVYVSDYVRHVFGQNHPSHITVYPGSDFSHFVRKSSERLADDCIGMVYRLERDKLNEDAIVPFIKAVQKRPQTRVLIVGGGGLLEPFRHAVAAAGLNDNFEFTGYVSYEALPDLYRRMSVFVAPVWKESFGQVSAFAMNMRIPVVGYDIGAIGEIVANQSLLAEPENPEMLSDIIVRLLESPVEREKLGEFQRRRAQDYFSVQAMIKAYGAIYQEMMAEHTPKNMNRLCDE